MRKQEFLEQLEALLYSIPEEERKEAMQYYRDYFEDAGEENEQNIIRELESPWKVAEAVKADFSTAPSGYEEPGKETEENTTQQHTSKAGRTIIIILLVILLAPVIFTGVSFIFGVLMSIVGISIGLTIASIAVIGVCAFILFKGCTLLATAMGLGLLLMGLSLIGIVLALIFLVLFIKLLSIVLSFLIKKIKKFFHWFKTKTGGR